MGKSWGTVRWERALSWRRVRGALAGAWDSFTAWLKATSQRPHGVLTGRFPGDRRGACTLDSSAPGPGLGSPRTAAPVLGNARLAACARRQRRSGWRPLSWRVLGLHVGGACRVAAARRLRLESGLGGRAVCAGQRPELNRVTVSTSQRSLRHTRCRSGSGRTGPRPPPGGDTALRSAPILRRSS